MVAAMTEALTEVGFRWFWRVIGGVLLFFAIYSTWLAPAPTVAHYQHPHFVSRVVETRADAQIFEAVTVRHGETVYRVIDYTLTEKIAGRVSDRWLCENGFQMFGSERPNFGVVGRRFASVPVVIPQDIPPGVSCEYQVAIEYPREIFGSQYFEAEPITFRVKS